MDSNLRSQAVHPPPRPSSDRHHSYHFEPSKKLALSQCYLLGCQMNAAASEGYSGMEMWAGPSAEELEEEARLEAMWTARAEEVRATPCDAMLRRATPSNAMQHHAVLCCRLQPLPPPPPPPLRFRVVCRRIAKMSPRPSGAKTATTMARRRPTARNPHPPIAW